LGQVGEIVVSNQFMDVVIEPNLIHMLVAIGGLIGGSRVVGPAAPPYFNVARDRKPADLSHFLYRFTGVAK
jgi:hypothetical protein